MASSTRDAWGDAACVVLRRLRRDSPFGIGLGKAGEPVAKGLEEKATFAKHLAGFLSSAGRGHEDDVPLAREQVLPERPGPEGTQDLVCEAPTVAAVEDHDELMTVELSAGAQNQPAMGALGT